MPFKSQSQRGLFYHMLETGEMSPETVKHWEDETPKGKKLPKHVRKKMHKHAFIESFEKVAGIKEMWHSAPTLDKAGLGLLAAAPAYHTAKAIKKGDKKEAALGASELGGLGLLYRSVQKAH